MTEILVVVEAPEVVNIEITVEPFPPGADSTVPGPPGDSGFPDPTPDGKLVGTLGDEYVLVDPLVTEPIVQSIILTGYTEMTLDLSNDIINIDLAGFDLYAFVGAGVADGHDCRVVVRSSVDGGLFDLYDNDSDWNSIATSSAETTWMNVQDWQVFAVDFISVPGLATPEMPPDTLVYAVGLAVPWGGTAGHVLTSTGGTAAFQWVAPDVTQAELDAAQATAIQRSNHTGTQTSATVSDFVEAVQDAVAAMLTQGTNVTLTYDDTANTLTVTAVGGDAEVMRDTIGAALVGIGNIAVTINDALDTITISTTATVNSTDAALRDRSTHTGSQAQSTVTDLVTDLGAKVPITRAVATGTGLTGGGDLSADRTLAPDFGTGAGKVTQGNDARLADARTPTVHAASHELAGSDPLPIPGRLLALPVNYAASATMATTSTTFVDADAANLAVTFTFPVSGRVLLTQEAWTHLIGAATTYNWGLREGSTPVTGADVSIGFSGNHNRRAVVTYSITGTPGATVTYKWAHRLSFGSASSGMQASSTSPAVMIVRAA